jgi:hypothetical protein
LWSTPASAKSHLSTIAKIAIPEGTKIAECMAQEVESLPSKYEVLSSNLSTTKIIITR